MLVRLSRNVNKEIVVGMEDVRNLSNEDLIESFEQNIMESEVGYKRDGDLIINEYRAIMNEMLERMRR